MVFQVLPPRISVPRAIPAGVIPTATATGKEEYPEEAILPQLVGPVKVREQVATAVERGYYSSGYRSTSSSW